MWTSKVILATVVVCLLVPALWATDAVLTARVFQLEHIEVKEAIAAIQPLLSDDGSFMVQPAHSRLTVQDSPEVVARVADVLAVLDRDPQEYRIRVDLFEASKEPQRRPGPSVVDEGVRRMFPYESYRRIGGSRFEGEVGGDVRASLGKGYRIAFSATASDLRALELSASVSSSTGAGIISPPHVREQLRGPRRLHLQQLTLYRVNEAQKNQRIDKPILRTSVVLAPGQRVVLGISPSEQSDEALIMIVQSEREED